MHCKKAQVGFYTFFLFHFFPLIADYIITFNEMVSCCDFSHGDANLCSTIKQMYARTLKDSVNDASDKCDRIHKLLSQLKEMYAKLLDAT